MSDYNLWIAATQGISQPKCTGVGGITISILNWALYEFLFWLISFINWHQVVLLFHLASLLRFALITCVGSVYISKSTVFRVFIPKWPVFFYCINYYLGRSLCIMYKILISHLSRLSQEITFPMIWKWQHHNLISKINIYWYWF